MSPRNKPFWSVPRADLLSLPSLQMFLVIGKKRLFWYWQGPCALLRWLFKESPEWWFVIIYFYRRYLATSRSWVRGCGDGAILLRGPLLEGSTALCPPAKGWVSLLCMEMICLEHLWWRRYAELDLQLECSRLCRKTDKWYVFSGLDSVFSLVIELTYVLLAYPIF